MMHVYHDPGHGGPDPGTCHNGIVEKDWVLEIARDIASAVGWCSHQLSRTEDVNLSLDGAAVSAEGADLAMCHHVNALEGGKADGLMCFYLHGDHVGREVGAAIMRAAPAELQRRKQKPIPASPNNWTSHAYNVLKPFAKRAVPAVLIEWGFATSPTDAAILADPAARPALCAAAAAGIARAFELKADHHGV